MRARSTILVASAVGGLFLGPALDQIHVRTGALDYSDPWWLDQAWWVAPQFAIAFAIIAAGSLQILGLGTDIEHDRPSTRTCALCVATFVAAYALTGIAHEREWTVVAVLGVAVALRLVLERPDPRAIVAILALVVGGTAYEATLTSVPDTFDYAVTSLLTVPAWLPLLYAHGGFAVVALLRRTA